MFERCKGTTNFGINKGKTKNFHVRGESFCKILCMNDLFFIIIIFFSEKFYNFLYNA